MKTIATSLFLLLNGVILAQTSPILNQKLTDYFVYDPSRTGYSGGSLVFTHQQLSSGLNNAPVTDFLGAHTRLFFDRVGIGGSVYYQQAGITKNYRITLNGAYHLKLNDQFQLSFGLSPEFTRGELDFESIFVIDSDDQVINEFGNKSSFDISSGMSLHHTLFDLGIVANRLMSITQGSDSERLFSGMYSAYLQGKIPVRSELDLFEPMAFFNVFQDGTSQIDVGGFYQYEDILYAGLMYRTPSIAAFSLGYLIKSRLIIGYTFQTPLGNSEAIGNSHEVTIRFNFNKQYFDLIKGQRNTTTISPEKKGN